MKIIFFIGQLGLGGGERQLYLLLKGINRVKINPVVVCFNQGGDYWGKYIEEVGVPVIYIPAKHVLPRILYLRKLLIKLRPDVGISWDIQTNPYLAILSRIYPFKKYFGGVRCNLFRQGRSSWERWISLVGIDNFIVNSSQGKKHITLLKSKARIFLLYNGFATFQLPENGKSELKVLSAITDDLPVILFVGGLKPVKNPELLLNSFFVMSERVDAHLVFIGTGSLAAMLQEKARAHPVGNRVHFLGQQAEAFRLMPGADILVLTSVTEGMPGVLVEGGYAGLPLVATNVGGVDDIIVEGFNGFVVPSDSTSMLTNRLTELLMNPLLRYQMGKNSRERVEQYFTDTRMVKEFEKLMDI